MVSVSFLNGTSGHSILLILVMISQVITAPFTAGSDGLVRMEVSSDESPGGDNIMGIPASAMRDASKDEDEDAMAGQGVTPDLEEVESWRKDGDVMHDPVTGEEVRRQTGDVDSEDTKVVFEQTVTAADVQKLIVM